jgi:hypothetical protein
MFLKYRYLIISIFVALAIGSGFYATKLKFSFSFDQFFPQGDPDLAFYNSFIKEFESDDNFLFIAVKSDATVFDSTFLNRFHEFTLASRSLPHITKAQSLTTIRLPIKTPFGYVTRPMIHLNEPSRYEEDKEKILSDDRFIYSLIDSSATSLVVALKTEENLNMEDSKELLDSLEKLTNKFNWNDKTHLLGRAYFQKALIDFQKEEIGLAFLSSLILVSLIMILIYRKAIGVVIALSSIALGLLLFLGFLGVTGQELNAISALFPVIMLIVGSSDVIHIFSKYVDELNVGHSLDKAMDITIKQIGLATLMTSVTTAIGFLSLTTSKLKTIQTFGFNAAIGVMIAYITVIFFTTSVLSLFGKERIIKTTSKESKWNSVLNYFNTLVLYKRKNIYIVTGVLMLVFFVGIKLIDTNYNIENNLPYDAKVTTDFKYFEKNYAGFRPLEFAIMTKTEKKANSFEVLREVDKLEQKIKTYPSIKTTISLATMHRSIYKMNHADADYFFPSDSLEFEESARILDRYSGEESTVLLNKAQDKTRLSSRIVDIGADSIKSLGIALDKWINTELDTNLIEVKRTGTGLILDKNSEYVTNSLIKGLGLSVLIISLLMGILFRSFKMVFLAMIPNILPLFFAAAMMGYIGIDLEAGVSIMFAIVFGIAVDDTIHFLSRFKIGINNGKTTAEAINTTMYETGKAIIFTTIVLFFGFFTMVLSSNPPTFTVGVLISVTLIGALICDLLLLPALLITFYNKP